MEKKLDRLDQPHEVETTKVNKSRKRTREQNKENDTPAKKRKTPAKQAPAKQAPAKQAPAKQAPRRKVGVCLLRMKL